MNLKRIFAAVFLILALAAVQAFAAGTDHKGATNQSATGGEDKIFKSDFERITNLTGATVKGNRGEDLGKVQDFVLDRNGQVKYMILSKGGILGFGGDFYAVPWVAVEVGRDNNIVVGNIDQDKMAKAPSFDSNSWPDFSDPKVNQSLFSFYMSSGHRDVDRPRSGMDTGAKMDSGIKTETDVQSGMSDQQTEK